MMRGPEVAASWRPLVFAALFSCGRPSAGEGTGSTPSAQPAPGAAHVIAEQLSSPSSFELVADSDGLSLVWASAEPGPGWLFQAALDQRGRVSGVPRRHALPAHALGRVTDLVAAARDEQLLAGWLEQGEREARAQAGWLLPEQAPSVLDLGPAALVSLAARGNMALALEAAGGDALLLWRGLEVPCAGQAAGPCTGFNFRRLNAGGSEVTGLPLAVPVPCASHAVQLATAPGRFHYGVCTRQGHEPVTTMFSIQSNPEFARAEALLPGCTPLGTVDAGERAWLVGDCHGRRRAARIPLLDEAIETEPLDAMRVSCSPRRLAFAKGRFALELSTPRAGLERVLPPDVVPTGARVGYGGATLIIAYTVGAQLATRALGCRDGRLSPL